MAFKAYKLADILRTAVGAPTSHRQTTALIAAAGSSTRMGGEVSKQLLEVDGIPVLARTLLAHQMADTVDEIVLIARREDFDAYLALAKTYGITKLKRITTGGSSRQESVLHGFEAVSEGTEFVAISDGARCLVTPEMIDRVNMAAWKHDAACAATPATDTVKLVTEKHYTQK
ncbi:MAG: 2-C-methyl-D-erythritol 4-phosphate cytidylyltransferase, partial [Clostridia bacterium]|nr:2-C-methyl-D-erythritol 4-phosphate cytidylyltransferase [Clostridia bacterium]